MRHSTTRQRTKARDRRSANEQIILEAFEAALVGQAFGDLRVEDVMARTQLGRTAFYRYFPDLEAALLHQLGELNDEFAAASGRWLSSDADPTRGLFDAAIDLAAIYRDHADLLRAFAEAASARPDVDHQWQGLVDVFIVQATGRIESFVAAGLSQVDHPEETARALIWMTERYLQETYGRGRPVPLRVAAETLAQIWRRTLFAPA